MYEDEGEIGAGSPTHPLRCSLTVDDVLAAHAQFGQLNKASVKAAMGSNWPARWDDVPDGAGIFEPVQDQIADH